MTQLIAVLSTGKGTWGHVGRLMTDGTWDDGIVLISNDFGKENFTNEKEFAMITVNSRQSTIQLVEDIKNGLADKIKGTEVALNIISGDGKEHMATLAALLKLGVGIRLMALTPDGIKEL